jgi:hypothetical protein
LVLAVRCLPILPMNHYVWWTKTYRMKGTYYLCELLDDTQNNNNHNFALLQMLLAIRNSDSSAKFIWSLQPAVNQLLWSSELWTGNRS